MSRILIALLALTAGALSAADTPAPAPAAGQAKPIPYPLDTCIVSGDKLGTMGNALVVVREGREIKLCCAGCIKDLDKDPAKFFKKIDEAVAAKAAGPATAPAAK